MILPRMILHKQLKVTLGKLAKTTQWEKLSRSSTSPNSFSYRIMPFSSCKLPNVPAPPGLSLDTHGWHALRSLHGSLSFLPGWPSAGVQVMHRMLWPCIPVLLKIRSAFRISSFGPLVFLIFQFLFLPISPVHPFSFFSIHSPLNTIYFGTWW